MTERKHRRLATADRARRVIPRDRGRYADRWYVTRYWYVNRRPAKSAHGSGFIEPSSHGAFRARTIPTLPALRFLDAPLPSYMRGVR